MRHRQHHPDHAPRRALNNAQAGRIAAGAAAASLPRPAQNACWSASESCGPAGRPWSRPSPCGPILRDGRCRCGTMMSIMRSRSSRLIAATFFCASKAAFTASSTVAKTPSRAAQPCAAGVACSNRRPASARAAAPPLPWRSPQSSVPVLHLRLLQHRAFNLDLSPRCPRSPRLRAHLSWLASAAPNCPA